MRRREFLKRTGLAVASSVAGFSSAGSIFAGRAKPCFMGG